MSHLKTDCAATSPARLDLSRQAAEAGRGAATRALTSAVFDADARTTLAGRILVDFTVLQALTGRLYAFTPHPTVYCIPFYYYYYYYYY